MICPRTLGAIVLAAALGAGCIKAPDLVIVDRKTALEQQAGGVYRRLEDDLERAALSPRPAPLTGAELAQAGAAPSAGPSSLGADEEAGTDPGRIDALLKRRCVGEALDGTLAETPSTCLGLTARARVGRLVERVNRDRWQVWRYLQAKRPAASLDEVRRVWREIHLQSVVCGGQVEKPGGGWEAKPCE